MLKIERSCSVLAICAIAHAHGGPCPTHQEDYGPYVTMLHLSDGMVLSLWRRQEVGWTDTRNLDLTRLLSVYPLKELVARARPISKTNKQHVCLTIYETLH